MNIKTDNDILNFIKISGQNKKEVYTEPKMPEMSSDVYLNWTKTSSRNATKDRQKFVEAAKQLQEMGLSEDQTRNSLIGDGCSIEEAKRATAAVFVKEIKTAIAKSYDDVAPTVEDIISVLPRKEFMKAITANGNLEEALVVFASKKAETNCEELLKYAEMRSYEPSVMAQLHEVLKPHIEKEINRSFLLAEVLGDDVKLASSGRKQVFAMQSDNESFEVDLAKGHCTCHRFASKGFEAFGIPCEHIVMAWQKTDSDAMAERMMQEFNS